MIFQRFKAPLGIVYFMWTKLLCQSILNVFTGLWYYEGAAMFKSSFSIVARGSVAFMSLLNSTLLVL